MKPLRLFEKYICISALYLICRLEPSDNFKRHPLKSCQDANLRDQS